jgi:hypothetical protein
MTDEQVYQFIVQAWDKRDPALASEKSWDLVAKKLADKGHISKRTGRPLNGGACRHIYYHFAKKPTLAKGELKHKIALMKDVLKLKATDDVKLRLIEQMLSQLES